MSPPTIACGPAALQQASFESFDARAHIVRVWDVPSVLEATQIAPPAQVQMQVNTRTYPPAHVSVDTSARTHKTSNQRRTPWRQKAKVTKSQNWCACDWAGIRTGYACARVCITNVRHGARAINL